MQETNQSISIWLFKYILHKILEIFWQILHSEKMLVYLIWGLYLGQTLLFEARNFEFCSNFHASRYTILLRKLSKHYPIFGKLYLRWPDQFWQHDIGTSMSHTFFKGRMLACHYHIVHSEKENSASINSCKTVCRFTY